MHEVSCLLITTAQYQTMILVRGVSLLFAFFFHMMVGLKHTHTGD